MNGLITAFQDALAYEGLIWLVAAVFVAGLVRGFSGFGTAMIYMPVATQVISPIWALTTVIIFDLFGPIPNVPRAWRDGQPRDVLRLGIGAMISLPFGVYLLTRIDPVNFRWMVSVVALILLALLIMGWRYKGVVTKALSYGIGVMGGFLGGFSGLSGPPVIMFYMSSALPAATIRANILLYLVITDLLSIAVFGANGILSLVPLVMGAILAVPFTVANVLGAAIFDPAKEMTYRRVAYGIIAISAASGLPLFD